MVKNKTILITIITVLTILFSWFSYTLSYYDTIFSPHYLIGLDNSDKYYQRNISDKLKRKGREIKISDVDTSNWNVFTNEKYNFSLKYPDYLEIISLREDNSIIFASKSKIDDIKKCVVSVSRHSWAVSLPRTRTNLYMQNPLYYISRNDMAYMIQNLRNENIENKLKSGKFDTNMEVIFFNDGNHIFVNFEGDCNAELFKGVLKNIKF